MSRELSKRSSSYPAVNPVFANELFKDFELGVNKIFEDFFGIPSFGQVRGSVKFPKLDAWVDNDSNLRIEATVPGYTMENISVSVNNDIITISGSSCSDKEDKNEFEDLRFYANDLDHKYGDQGFINEVIDLALSAWSNSGNDISGLNLTKENIRIDPDGTIDVFIRKSDIRGKERQHFYSREIHRSSFCRSIMVNPDVHDLENISAKLNNGILSLTVPTKNRDFKEPSIRNIEIEE